MQTDPRAIEALSTEAQAAAGGQTKEGQRGRGGDSQHQCADCLGAAVLRREAAPER